MRINYLILVLLTLIAQQLSSQESEKRNHFGFGITPQLGVIEQHNEGQYESKPQLSITIDANVIRKLSDRVELHAGLGLQKAKLSQRDYSPLFPSDHDGMGGADFKKSYYEIPVDYVAIGIPVSFQFKFSDRPSYFFLNVGLQVRQVLHSKENFQLIESGLVTHQLDYEDLNINLRKTQFFTMGTVGYKFALKENSSVSIGVNQNYSMLNIFQGDPFPSAAAFIGGNPVFYGLRLFYEWGKEKKKTDL